MNLEYGEGNLHFQTMSVEFKGFLYYQENFEWGVTFLAFDGKKTKLKFWLTTNYILRIRRRRITTKKERKIALSLLILNKILKI